jgi:hypothetical protein
VPHGGQQRADADLLPQGGRPPRARGEPGQHRLDHGVERQAALQVLLGREPDLGVDDAVGREVLGALGRHPHEGVRGLHDGDGVVEGLQVPFERARVGGLHEPLPELAGVGGGQGMVDVGGQLDDGRRTQPAVEVVVQQRLRGLDDLFHADCDHGKTLVAEDG